jgi:hypothetical protein
MEPMMEKQFRAGRVGVLQAWLEVGGEPAGPGGSSTEPTVPMAARADCGAAVQWSRVAPSGSAAEFVVQASPLVPANLPQTIV